MSDIFALEICIITQLLISKMKDVNCSRFKRQVIFFIIGVLIYCQYNVRTIYLFASIFFLLEILYITVGKKCYFELFF